MSDFTKLNGYNVKDSVARTNIDKFNLSNVASLTFSDGGGNMLGQTVKLAYDDTGSIGKIYGRMVLNTSGYNITDYTLTATLPFNVGEGFTIDNIGIRLIYNTAINNIIDVKGFSMSLAGTTATISFTNSTSTEGRHSLEFYASIIFFKDFGDSGDPTS